MKLASSVMLVAVVACGSNSSSAQLAPLPPDPSPSQVAAAPEKPDEPVAKQEHEPPKGPLEATIPAPQTAVKLVAKGRGKLAPLRYTAKPGTGQRVELRMDFTARQTEGTTTEDDIIQTMVLHTESETTAVDASGKAEFTLKLIGSDAVDVPGSKVTAEQFRKVTGSLAGLAISGTVDPTGHAGDVKLRVEQPSDLTEGA